MKPPTPITAYLLFADSEYIRRYPVPSRSFPGQQNALKKAQIKGAELAAQGRRSVRVHAKRGEDEKMELVWEMSA